LSESWCWLCSGIPLWRHASIYDVFRVTIGSLMQQRLLDAICLSIAHPVRTRLAGTTSCHSSTTQVAIGVNVCRPNAVIIKSIDRVCL